MNEPEYLAERFEEHRTHLRAVAYRMLGSLSEVDDAVQEAWLRLSRTNATGIDNLGGDRYLGVFRAGDGVVPCCSFACS